MVLTVHADRPLVARVEVPTRICDLGGWTDTWFARSGSVCHLPVWPGIDVQVAEIAGPPAVEVEVAVFGRTWTWNAGLPPAACPDPLVAAALDEGAPPPDRRYRLVIRSSLPAGASMGTSASTCVAILAASDAMCGRQTPIAVQAARAHRVETDRLGWQSGVQDQFAALGGPAHLVTIDDYPTAHGRRLSLPVGTRDALDAALVIVSLGRGHSSTAVHEQVVRSLADAGPGDARLGDLRALALEGAMALEAGDLRRYGACLTANTEVQARLHPSLVSPDARQVMALAARLGARGWKVNGAGGDGGTISILCAEATQRATLVAALAREAPQMRVLDVHLAEAPDDQRRA